MINNALRWFRPLVSKLYGSTANSTLERQILLWILLFTGTTFLLGAINNYLLHIPSIIIPFGVGILCLVLYLLARFSPVWAARFTFAPFITYMMVTTDSWFSNAGITGSVPLFFPSAILAAMILLRRRQRVYMIALLFLHFALLMVIQQWQPALVRPYASVAIKQSDLLVSLAMAVGYSLGCVLIVHHHLEQRRRQAERLLLNILPLPIAERLRYHYTGAQTIADSYTASVMFIDIVNFTALSSTMQPVALVAFLNDLFSHFDMLAEAYGVEKIKTIGDCYMVAAGVPYPRPDHAHVLLRMALTIQSHLRRLRFQGYQPAFRIGINTGPVVAGIIGRQKFIYDLWGDAVNVASRMESQGVAGAIQITQPIYELVKHEFICINQGVIEVKGKGPMPIWHVIGMQPTAAPALMELPERSLPLYPYREAYGNPAAD